ncbi:hypothetical protein ACCO45_005952 [Purpureocillium lilacinum]|uniref:Uncharacterized protein n=1 Tax=Purpureocillium lilacinum TaxID=33203 RepID=A0ACC4DWY0_PURLI
MKRFPSTTEYGELSARSRTFSDEAWTARLEYALRADVAEGSKGEGKTSDTSTTSSGKPHLLLGPSTEDSPVGRPPKRPAAPDQMPVAQTGKHQTAVSATS